jgi:xylulokinase
MAFLGVDLGSSSCKAAVFNEDGALIASGSAGYDCIYTGRDMAECEPEQIWGAFVRSVRNIGEAASEVEAMCISTHGETIVPVGSYSMNAVMNSDNRAANEIKELENMLGSEKIYKIAGLPASATFSVCKIMWLKKYAPEIYNNTRVFHSPHSYLLEKMGLAPVSDYTVASRYLAFDMHKCEWSDEICAAADINKAKLPEVAAAGTVCGKLSPEIASLLGLKAGIPVAAGGHDQPCASVGSGISEPGKATVSAGTYEVLGVTSEKPPAFEIAVGAGIHTTRHMLRDCYFSFGFFSGGHLSSWVYNLIGGGDYDKYEREGLAFNAPTDILITPHLTGSGTPHFDAGATGAIIGVTPSAAPGIIYRAAYEGIACELANIVDIFESAGAAFSEINIFGGNAKSDLATQLRADICGKTFVRAEISDAVARGAAVMAARAVGGNLKTAQADSGIFKPEKTAEYAGQRRKYNLLYELLQPLR